MTGMGVGTLAVLLTGPALLLGWLGHRRWRRRSGRRVVLTHPLPAHLRDRLRRQYPQLGDAQLEAVERGLRQYFAAVLSAGGAFVAMPSKVVDALWHEFILHTRAYDTFCRAAFGRMLHHTPAEALPAGRVRDERLRTGLRRAWQASCREEGIDPRRADRLPLLFGLDAALGIAGGYHYVPDCRLLGADRGDTHCAATLGCGGAGEGGSPGDGPDGCGGSDGGGDGGGD